MRPDLLILEATTLNLFVSDRDPYLSAQALDNRRLVKMVLETAQLLSTTMWELDDWGPYRPTHRNHPCSRWVRESAENFAWTLEHFAALCTEYTHRYGKVHKCTTLYPTFSRYLDDWDEAAYWTDVQEFTYHNSERDGDIPFRYRDYLAEKWRNDGHLAKWGDRGEPSWRTHHSQRLLERDKEGHSTGA